MQINAVLGQLRRNWIENRNYREEKLQFFVVVSLKLITTFLRKTRVLLAGCCVFRSFCLLDVFQSW